LLLKPISHEAKATANRLQEEVAALRVDDESAPKVVQLKGRPRQIRARGDDWRCARCEHFAPPSREQRIYCLPEVLLSLLDRYRRGADPTKIHGEVEFPDILELAEAKGPAWLRLFAVCDHHGRYGFGHHTAFSEVGQDEWCEFDDSRVTKIERKRAHTKDACLLCHARTQGDDEAALENLPDSLLDQFGADRNASSSAGLSNDLSGSLWTMAQWLSISASTMGERRVRRSRSICRGDEWLGLRFAPASDEVGSAGVQGGPALVLAVEADRRDRSRPVGRSAAVPSRRVWF
jgi:hypothetical protein